METAIRQDKAEQMEIAKTILAQIGRQACWFFGIHNSMALDSNENRMGGVQFSAKGEIKKSGKILVELAFNDTYTVISGHLYNCEWKEDKKEEGVYCDALQASIDEMLNGKKGMR